MYHDEKHVKTGDAVVVWDGVTRPSKNDQDRLVHSLKIALLPGAPELAELEAIAKAALAADPTMKGNLPAGGHWPITLGAAGDIDPALAGHTAINAKTYNGAPQVYDANGRQLDATQYGPLLYAGAIVKVILSAYAYTNIQKGVAFSLDGFQIIDATTPKLSIASGFDATGAFGAAPVAPIPPGAAAPAPPVAPHTGFLHPGGVPPVPGAAPVPPAPLAVPVKTMTAKAAGKTYDEFIAAGWTSDQLIAQGYMAG